MGERLRKFSFVLVLLGPAPACWARQATMQILVPRFRNTPRLTASDVEAVKEQYFGAKDSVAAIFREMSYGQFDVTGEVDVVDLPFDATQDEQTFVKGLNDNNVQTPAGSFDYGGWRILFTGEVHPPYLGLGGSITLHELGHELGLEHACSWQCRDSSGRFVAPATAGARCVDVPYGDQYDVMGKTPYSIPHFNALHKIALGWLSAANAAKTSTDGVYDVYALESPSSGTQALTLAARAAPGNQSYTLEYRAQGGGVAVHFPMMTFDGFGGCDTMIVQHPDGQLLMPGRSFDDGLVHVVVLSADPTKAVVQVHFGPTPAPPPRPTVKIWTPEPGEALSSPATALVEVSGCAPQAIELDDGAAPLATLKP